MTVLVFSDFSLQILYSLGPDAKQIQTYEHKGITEKVTWKDPGNNNELKGGSKFQ